MGSLSARAGQRPIITLLTDFGSGDAYVACMKGVILSICPEATVVDLSHEVPKFNVIHGAFLLAQAACFFPEGTVHVAVVDPGVGTKRLPLAVSTKRSVLIGPDNGVLDLAARSEGLRDVYEIRNQPYVSQSPAPTFAGRDVFAPAAAHVAKGTPLEALGPRLKGMGRLRLPRPRIGFESLAGSVIYVDSFGSLVTNVPEQAVRQRISVGQRIRLKVGTAVETIVYAPSYGFVKRGEPLALIGSAGLLEIAVNQGRASERFNASEATPVELSFG